MIAKNKMFVRRKKPKSQRSEVYIYLTLLSMCVCDCALCVACARRWNCVVISINLSISFDFIPSHSILVSNRRARVYTSPFFILGQLFIIFFPFQSITPRGVRDMFLNRM